jgi:hypothetical protein
VNRIKDVICSHCDATFQAARVDAKRCPACREVYLQAYRRKPSTVQRKKDIHRKVREEAFAGYGGKCTCCGEDKFEFLALDHVFGGGGQERKVKSTHQIARKVITQDFPKEYQILCHNCNMAKGFFGKCPHEQERTA